MGSEMEMSDQCKNLKIRINKSVGEEKGPGGGGMEGRSAGPK